MKCTGEEQKLLSDESHPVTDPLGESCFRNKRRSCENVIKYNNNKHSMIALYKRCKKHNEIQLTKNKMDLDNRKMKNNPPSPK